MTTRAIHNARKTLQWVSWDLGLRSYAAKLKSVMDVLHRTLTQF